MRPRAPSRTLAGAVLGAWLALAGDGPASASPSTSAWLTAAWGRESDLTLSPGPAPVIVAGGPFASFITGATVRTGAPRRSHLELGGQGWYERFTEASGRRLLSAALVADGLVALSRRWAVRVGVGGHHFDDSARDEARRLAGWGEAGVVWSPGPLRLELQGGVESRRYPELDGASGAAQSYTETQASGGSHAALQLGRRAVLRAAWHTRRTEAADPWYDDRGLVVEAGAETALRAGVTILVDAFLQERRFTARPADRDRDRYRQAGVGVAWEPDARWRVRVNGVVSRYTWPDGTDVDTNRWQVSVTRRFGRGGAELPEPHRLPRDDDPDLPRAGRPVSFGLQAPDAQAVAVVGDFNGWDPTATPLTRAGGGSWRTALRLPAGTYAYAFVVDGVWVTPPNAAATEDDGFGGRNGVLVVLP